MARWSAGAGRRYLRHSLRRRLGRAVQIDPIKPKLKAPNPKHKLKGPGTKRLKLKFDKLLPSFAFKFNLRRYNSVLKIVPATGEVSCVGQLEDIPDKWQGGFLVGPDRQCSPRQVIPLNSRNECLHC